MTHKAKFSDKVALIFPDVHLEPTCLDGTKPVDRHDEKALSLAFQLSEYVNPDIKVQLGDLANMGYFLLLTQLNILDELRIQKEKLAKFRCGIQKSLFKDFGISLCSLEEMQKSFIN